MTSHDLNVHRLRRTTGGTTPGLILIASVVLILIVPAACRNANVPDTPTVATPSPIATSTADDDRLADPGELAAYLIDRAMSGDWATVRTAMPEAYQQFDLNDIARFTNVRDFANIPLHVEQEGDHATVRAADQGVMTMVLLRDHHGEWRYDPGDWTLQMLRLAAEHQEPLETQIAPAFSQHIESDLDALELDALFRHRPLALVVTNGEPALSVAWVFIDGATGRLEPHDAEWRLGEQRGAAEVTWTTGVWDSEDISFPLPRGAEMLDDRRLEIPYSVRFKLNDVPPDWSDELELHIDGLVVEQNGVEQELKLIYHLPEEEFPQLAR